MKLLVVEDEVIIAKALKKGLEQEKYIVDVAHTGTEGFDLALSENYDAVILDILLPEMDGITVCKKLRSEKKMMPILLLTARDQIGDKVKGLDIGADDYLTKPFAFEELVARIKALLRRPALLSEEVLISGDLRLNTQTFAVDRARQTIPLSHKEFSLLEFMLRHPGQVITKDLLIAQVWDYDSDILPNTVEVTIRNLRKKIDIAFPNLKPLITTRRGYGYKLGGE